MKAPFSIKKSAYTVKTRAARKLRSRTGETLVETLAAILIVTFSGILLVTSIMTALKINKTAEESDAKYRAELNVAEARTDGRDGTSIKYTIEYKDNSGLKQIKNGDMKVIYFYLSGSTSFGGDELISYLVDTAGGEG
ncbi:MAG TPA: hypothetical protein PKZ58_06735 [Bacillota bacterium]|nr:hypothetical protein [Bacillota bacterium]